MDDQNVHPLIRYGGPVLGAILVYWVISTMVGGFQADLEEARREALLAREVVLEEGAEAPGEAVTGEETAGAEQEAQAEGATDADAFAGLPEAIAAFFPDQTDPAQGEQLVVSTGCTACHSLEEGVVQVGPSWYGLADTAANRVEGQSAAEYLYTSIVAPNEHVVEDFQPNLMPQNYEDVLTEEQIAHIIAYLLTLESQE